MKSHLLIVRVQKGTTEIVRIEIDTFPLSD